MKTPPRIKLDAGHGGHDSGAVGPKGLREKDVALKVTLLLGAMLTAAGVDVSYTRKDDRFIELAERAAMANRTMPDLFLSIHCNSSDRRSASGFEVFTSPGQTASDVAATCVFMDYAKRFPAKLKRIDDADGDPDKEANFAVLRLSKMPALLFELDFISSPEVEAWLREPANQQAMAEALCDGVLHYFGMVPGVAATPAPAPTPAPEPVQASVREKLLELSAELLTQAKRLA